MARPPATILLSTHIDDFNSQEVLSASGLYAVLYKDKPFNLKTQSWTAKGQSLKYVRTTYPNKKPADNLAKKLNKDFFTKDFTVVKIL